MSLPTTPQESLHDTVAFDPRDWSLNKADAWIYGIAVGWGDSMGEVAAKHGWDDDAVERLGRLHRQFVATQWHDGRPRIAGYTNDGGETVILPAQWMELPASEQAGYRAVSSRTG